MLLQSGLYEALGNFIYSEGVNSVIGRSGPPEAEQKKGLKMPTSGKAVTDESIKSQLKTPFDRMPAFADITEEELGALIEYLKTL